MSFESWHSQRVVVTQKPQNSFQSVSQWYRTLVQQRFPFHVVRKTDKGMMKLLESKKMKVHNRTNEPHKLTRDQLMPEDQL